jgi:hypothetical protein
MHGIKIQQDVSLINLATDEIVKDTNGEPVVVTFKQFLLLRLVDQNFSKLFGGLEGIEKAQRIKAAIVAACEKELEIIQLETDDWKSLKEATVSAAYDIRVGHCLLGYITAVRDAKQV